jgi:23S rRNA (pseudouridine1915-N3)-methyltransferase
MNLKPFRFYQKWVWTTYQQAVNIAQMQQHILWRTNDSIQDVDKNCGHVDNFCGYLVCKLFVIKKRGLWIVNISIVTVGKLKEKYLKQGIDEYLKRLSAYAKVDILEVADEKAPEVLSEAEMIQVKQKEGERILAKISQDTYVIALAIQGKMQSSEELAESIDKLATYGKSKIAFVIGGSLGLSDDVIKRSNEQLSFSKMTFPHQLMKLILVEQIYRAFRINRGEPYHK